jgi:hypothetical protein
MPRRRRRNRGVALHDPDRRSGQPHRPPSSVRGRGPEPRSNDRVRPVAGLAVHRRLHEISGWPLAIVTRAEIPVGIAMHDLSDRFAVPFVMPSGRRDHVLLSLEHLLGSDDYLQLRGLGVRLDTAMRVRVAEHVSGALVFLHRHAIVQRHRPQQPARRLRRGNVPQYSDPSAGPGSAP